jgi:hypothetical protein
MVFAVPVLFILAAAISYAAPVSNEKIDISKFVAGAFLKYETGFSLPTTPERFGRMLDDLFFMGALWEAYGFTPRYRVVRIGTAWYVIDPSGLEGIISTVDVSSLQRTLIANGKLKNWFIPMTITGRALFILAYERTPGGITVRFTVYGEGSDSRMEQVMLKAISPILCHYIGHRVERNFRDLCTIVADLEKNPTEITRKLNGILVAELNRILEPSAPPSRTPKAQ